MILILNHSALNESDSEDEISDNEDTLKAFIKTFKPASVGPFVGFTDPRASIERYSKRAFY